MPKLLSQAFANYYDSVKSSSKWHKLLNKLYQDQPFLYEDIKPLIEECLNDDISSSETYFLFLRDFYQILIGFKLSNAPEDRLFGLVYPLYRKLIKHQNFCQGYLSSLYTFVISKMLGLKPPSYIESFDLSSPQLFQSGINQVEYHLPKLHFLSEKALVLCLAGIQMQDVQFINAAIKCCCFLKQLVDSCGYFPNGLWVKENEWHSLDFLCGYTVLFCFAYIVTSHEEYQKIYDNLLKQLEPLLQNHEGLLPLYPLMTKHLEKLSESNSLISTGLTFTKEDLDEINKIFGLASFTLNDIHLNITCSGFQSGIGNLSKGFVKVVSMGPHLLPLGDGKFFGIHRQPILKQRAFKDVETVSSGDSSSFSGWTRVVSLDSKLSDTWLYVQSRLFNKTCFLNFEVKHQKEKKAVYMAFFVKAEKATISKSFHLVPGSLDRYLGTAEAVTFYKESSSLKFSTDSKTEMQVIPLAGHNYFWDADFLLAYNIKDEDKLSFEIY